jgi:hypothetical protein
MKEYKEIIEFGVRLFNFHPDSEFATIKDLLKTARKNCSYTKYIQTCSHYTEYLAKYIDLHNCK